MLTHLKKTARRLNLPFGDRRRTYNSRKAQELGKWAEEQGRGDAFHTVAFKTYFVEGKNLALIPVLEEITGRAGLDPSAVAVILAEHRYMDAVDRDWQRSRDLGVRAVPTFRLKGTTLTGAQSTTSLANLLELKGIQRRTGFLRPTPHPL